MAASRDAMLSLYLQWVVDFTQNIEKAAPGTCDLSKLARVIQDSFQDDKKTPMVGIQDISEYDDLILSALREIDKKRNTKKQINEEIYKKYVRKFTEALAHLITKEQAIYQEVIKMAEDEPKKYDRLFGYIKVRSGEDAIPTPEEVARAIVKGYGFGIFQHFIASYGNMVKDSRAGNDNFMGADAYFFQVFRLGMTDIVTMDGFLRYVVENQPIQVDAELVDQFVDESLRNPQMKGNIERNFGKVNEANTTTRSRKLSSEISVNKEQFSAKLKAYLEQRQGDALAYEGLTPTNSQPTSATSSPRGSDLARSTSAKAVSSSSLRGTPGRVVDAAPVVTTSPRPKASAGSALSGIRSLFKREKPPSENKLSLSSSASMGVPTKPVDETPEVNAQPLKKSTSKRKIKSKSLGAAPNRKPHAAPEATQLFDSVFKEEEESSFGDVFKEVKEEPQRTPAVEGLFQLATHRKSKLSSNTSTTATRDMDESEQPADTTESSTSKLKSPVLAKREKPSSSTNTSKNSPHRKTDLRSSTPLRRADNVIIPDPPKSPKGIK